MTYLEAVNEVLEELREDQVTSVSENDYSSLIGKLVNDAKKKVEDAWDWSMLRTSIVISTTADEFEYILTGAGKGFRMLKLKNGSPDVFNDTEDMYLQQPPQAWMSKMLNSNNVETGMPTSFGFNGYDTNEDPYIDIYPKPDGVYSINFNMVIPNPKLTSDDDTFDVPTEPVLRDAIYRAIRERGEDGGYSLADSRETARLALADAILYDRLLYPDENHWTTE